MNQHESTSLSPDLPLNIPEVSKVLVPINPICAAALDGKSVPQRYWHVFDIMPARTVTILSGDGGTGKSLLGLQLAVATALGRHWIGRPVNRGPALFLSAEDEMAEMQRRLVDVVAAESVRLADLDGLFLYSLAGVDALLAAPDRVNKPLRETRLYYALSAWIKVNRPSLVVLDTLADLFGGDELDRAQARQFIGILRRLALDHDCAVLLLAHPSLSGMARGDGASGSTAWNNSVRSRLFLRHVKGDGDSEPDPDRRELELMKANYGRKGAVIALRWEGGIFRPDTGSAADDLDRMAVSAKSERVFMRLLSECHANGRRVNHSGGNSYAPRVFADQPDAEGVTKAGFRKAMNNLIKNGQVRIETQGPPSRRVSFLTPLDEHDTSSPLQPQRDQP